MANVLVTGGAGFIGSHLVDALIAEGHQVVILDSLDPCVHGPDRKPPSYLSEDAKFVLGDMRDVGLVRHLVKNADVIYHLAAVTSLLQSERDIPRCISVNVLGTANLLSTMTNSKRLILASSARVYGEGKYACSCGPVFPRPRTFEQFQQGRWDLDCPKCNNPIVPAGTDESTPLRPASVYAISKRAQEDLCIHAGRVRPFPVVALRYFNVYGPRQSSLNPYTGILPVFTRRLVDGEPIEVYEDGKELRDFIHVRDAVRAGIAAMGLGRTEVLNVGAGKPVSVLEIAELLTDKMGGTLRVTGRYRTGDVRHSFADMAKTRDILKFEPEVSLSEGIDEWLAWNGEVRDE